MQIHLPKSTVQEPVRRPSANIHIGLPGRKAAAPPQKPSVPPRPLSFMDGFAIVDCAARIFAEERTSKWPDNSSAIRSFCRQNAVASLRYLWRTGDFDQRATVASRVAVWMNRTAQEIRSRVILREKARLATVQHQKAA